MHACKVSRSSRPGDVSAPRLLVQASFDHSKEVEEMKFLSVLRLAIGLSIPAVAALQGAAVAQSCPRACGLQKKACLEGPRANMAACRLDCRTNGTPDELGACLHGCAETFRSDREACRGGVADCVATCGSPESSASTSTPAACLGACGQDLGACARDVVTEARGCVHDCHSASDRLGCLQLCGATAQGGAEACASAFTSCRADCSVLPPVSSCGRAEAPTCGGSCPLPTLTCVPVSSTRCGCMAGSSSGAFVD